MTKDKALLEAMHALHIYYMEVLRDYKCDELEDKEEFWRPILDNLKESYNYLIDAFEYDWLAKIK